MNCVLDSPDETANYFWATRVGEGGELWYDEPLNGVARDLVKPRSFNVVDGRVVPGSFFGMPLLYGHIARLVGVGSIPFLTPLFASLAVIAFGWMIGTLFTKPVGLISAALLAVLPPWWYYAARGMYHNVLLMSLVIICVAILIRIINSHRSTFKHSNIQTFNHLVGWGLSGLCLGYSLVVRTSELVWVSIVVIGVLGYGILSIIKSCGWKGVPLPGFLLFIACGLIGLIPLFTTNIVLYGAPLSLSYRGVSGMEIGEFLSRLPEPPMRNLFLAPFGLAPRQALMTAKAFLLDFYSWWGWAAVVGVVLVFMRWLARAIREGTVGARFEGLGRFRVLRWFIGEERIALPRPNGTLGDGTDAHASSRLSVWAGYLCVFIIVSVLLIVYYGAWEFTDRVDAKTVSLNTSFFRYWMPIMVMGIPFIGGLIDWIVRLVQWKWARVPLTVGIVCMLAYPSTLAIITDHDESLFSVRARVPAARAERMLAVKELPPSAVVITFPQADKILFPAHTRVITGLHYDVDYEAVRALAVIEPVYVYTYADSATVANMSVTQFRPFGLEIVNGKKIFKNRWLWRIQTAQ